MCVCGGGGGGRREGGNEKVCRLKIPMRVQSVTRLQCITLHHTTVHCITLLPFPE